MPRTLYAQLAWVLFLLLLAIGLTYATVNTYVLQRHLAKIDQTFNRNLARNLVAERNLVREGRLDHQALKDTFHEYMEINPSIEIYLIDLSGALIAYSADPGKVVREQVSLDPIRSFLDGAGNYPLLGDDPRSFEGQKIFSVTPVPSAEEIEGYLYVVLRGQLFDKVGATITVDLEEMKVIAPDGAEFDFDMHPLKRRCLLEGLDDFAQPVVPRAVNRAPAPS